MDIKMIIILLAVIVFAKQKYLFTVIRLFYDIR